MILVTGGTGFLGAHLLYHLTSKGKKVKALKRKTSSTALTEKIFSYYTDNPLQLLQNIIWTEGDILDIHSLLDAMKDADFVYHTAAVVSFLPKDKETVTETNVQGTANVVNAALTSDVKKLCHVSSIAALGRAGNDGITDEESPWPSGGKKSVYSVSKHEAEREVWRGIAEGLNVVIVNPSVILGPGDWNNGSSRLFKTVYNGLKVYTAGTNGYVDVNDVAKAMILLMESDINNERFVLNSENVSYRQLFQWMAEGLGVKAPHIKANLFVSGIAWRILKVISLFSGKPPFITRETAHTANQLYFYSADKMISRTGFRFLPVKDSVLRTCSAFLKDNHITLTP